MPKHFINEKQRIELRKAFKSCKGKHEYKRLQIKININNEVKELKILISISANYSHDVRMENLIWQTKHYILW
jgi:hypothetical protein